MGTTVTTTTTLLLVLLSVPASTLASRVFAAAIESVSLRPTMSVTCAMHLAEYAVALVEPEDWAFKMFDSSTKVPEGIAFGAVTHLGNFDECLSVETPNFIGQHCLVSTTFEASENRSLPLDFPITTAICLPSSCSPAEAAEVMGAIVAALGDDYGWTLGKSSSKADPRQCHTSRPRPFSAADWAAACILIVFVLLLFLSTAYDLTVTNPENKKELLTAFSVYTNWRRLMNMKQPPGSLRSLHGVRFLSICWVVMGHRYTIATVLPSINGADFMPPAMRDWTRLYILNGTLSVDSFFMLSGLLASYVFYKEVDKRGSFSLVMYYVHRYVRLTPAFAMMVMLYATLIIHSRTGPIWDTSFEPLMDNCQRYWWANMLYIKNYYHPLEECVGQSWFLQVDMQLHWFSPLVLVPLWKKPRLGRWVVAFFFLLSFVVNFVSTYLKDLVVSLPERQFRHQKDSDWRTYMYYTTHTRFNSWLVGMVTGYLLFKMQKRKEPLRLPRVWVVALWSTATLLLLGSLFTMQPFDQPDYEYNWVRAALFHSFVRVAWSSGVAIVIFACCAGYGGPVNTFLSWTGFLPFSRLTYCIFLTHSALQTMTSYGTKTLFYIDDVTVTSQLYGDLVASVAVAVAWSLTFEAPFIIIEKVLTGKGGGGGKATQRRPPVKDSAATTTTTTADQVPQV